MKKKLIASILAAAMAVSMLAGCGENKNTGTSKESDKKTETTDTTDTTNAVDDGGSDDGAVGDERSP